MANDQSNLKQAHLTVNAADNKGCIRAMSCEGYITKRGHFRKSWRVRYPVLNGQKMHISYYESKDAYRNRKAAPKGAFYLQTAGKHEYWINQGVLGSPEEKPYGFKMAGHSSTRGYVELDVFVDSALDLNQWLQVINNGLEMHKRRARETVVAENTVSRSLLGFSFPTTGSPEAQQVKGYKSAQSSMIRSALKDAEAARSSGQATLEDLAFQGEKLDGVERVLTEVEDGLITSGKLLKSMHHPLRNLFANGKRRAKSADATSSSEGRPRNRFDTTDGSKCTVICPQSSEFLLEPMDDLEELALALQDLEHQATMINLEAIRSSEQISRIDTKIEVVNEMVQRQTTHASSLAKRANIF